jgi:hypothetical protein
VILGKRSTTVGRKQQLGLAGSIVLFIGVFTPIVTLPIVGSINYFHNGQGDGVLMLFLALISLGLTLRERYRWLWATGLLSLGLLLFTLMPGSDGVDPSALHKALAAVSNRGVANL